VNGASATALPGTVSRARSFGRLPFAFGPRVFVGLIVGFAWLAPAWWSSRFIVAMFLWDAFIFSAWLWDLLRLPAVRELEVQRVWRARPALGVPASVTIRLTNDGKLPVRATVIDETPRALRRDVPELLIDAPQRSAAEASYPIQPSQRGDTRLGSVFLRYQSSLHLAERRAVADLAQTVRVLPNIEEARRQTLRLIRNRQVDIERRRHRLRGVGRELESLRDYREGDEFRDISWTATARRNRPITRVFQMERSQTVWLVLDAGRLLRAQVEEPGVPQRFSKLDHAVNAALSLAEVAIHCGDRVGLLAYGGRVQHSIPPGRGAHHVRMLADSLAEVHAEAREPDHLRAVETLLGTQRRRSLIVWITDFAETSTTPEVIEYAAQMTPRHLVLFAAMSQPELAALAAKTPESPSEMYRHAAALEICQRRDILLSGLRRRGVLAFDWMPWGLSAALVNQYLDVKERNQL